MTTRRSPRTPKLKEPKFGEGSMSSTTRELDFTSKTESVIHMSTKNHFTEPPMFGDTEEIVGSKVVLPHWGGLYKKFLQEDYPEFMPHKNLNV